MPRLLRGLFEVLALAAFGAPAVHPLAAYESARLTFWPTEDDGISTNEVAAPLERPATVTHEELSHECSTD